MAQVSEGETKQNPADKVGRVFFILLFIAQIVYGLSLLWKSITLRGIATDAPTISTGIFVMVMALFYIPLIFKPKGKNAWMNKSYSVYPYIKLLLKPVLLLFVVASVILFGKNAYEGMVHGASTLKVKESLEPVVNVLKEKFEARSTSYRQYQVSPIESFERVAMPDATDGKLDEIFMWKSVVQSEPHPSDQGKVYLSLTPGNACESPLIWNVTDDKLIPVELPAASESQGNAVCVTSLGPFNGGLAPASVEYSQTTSSGKKDDAIRWGYVDTGGKWLIQPQYLSAGSFVGDVAVVSAGTRDFRIIDRQGIEQTPWRDTEDRRMPVELKNIQVERTGPWTLISHKGKWIRLNDTTGGEPAYLSDGSSITQLPGVGPVHSPDGQLWLLQTAEGVRLWKPVTGFVTLPDDLIPLRPISGNLFTTYSRIDRSSALYTIDGKLVADPAPIVTALTSNRYISCESGVSSSLSNWAELSRNVGPDLPNHRCGILDEQGKWWAPPVHQMIDRWGEYEVRLQSGTNACIADLRNDKAPDCATQLATNTLVPLLNIESFPRKYAYQKADHKTATPFQFLVAYPFIGQVAKVVDEMGFPGLIGQNGQWLTPRPSGSVLEETQLRAAIVQSPYRNRAPSGSGLIDRAGHWTIPPIFKDIYRYPDGSLQACQNVLVYMGNCQHLSVTGEPLPPTAERSLESMRWKQNENVAMNTPSPAQQDKEEKPQLVAMALNGKWGFQNDAGEWVIKPRFDDAEDFEGDSAAVGVMKDSASGGTKTLLWGRIDSSGNWIEQPNDDEPAAVMETSGQGGETMVSRTIPNSMPGVELGINTGDRFIPARDTSGGKNGMYGYVRQNGEWAIPPTFMQASPFVGDLAAAKDKLPELPGELRSRWITTDVQTLIHARMFVVRAEHPGAATAEEARFALVDDAGHWLQPESHQSFVSSLFNRE